MTLFRSPSFASRGGAGATAAADAALVAEGELFVSGTSISAVDLASGSLEGLVQSGMGNMGQSTPLTPTPLPGEE